MALVAASLLLFSGSLAAAQTTVSVTLNTRILSGSFGSSETTSLFYAPAGVRLDTGRFDAAAYFPYLTIHDGTVAPSAGGFVPMQGSLVDAPNSGMAMGSQMGRGMGGMMEGPSTPPVGSSPVAGTPPLTRASGLSTSLAAPAIA